MKTEIWSWIFKLGLRKVTHCFDKIKAKNSDVRPTTLRRLITYDLTRLSSKVGLGYICHSRSEWYRLDHRWWMISLRVVGRTSEFLDFCPRPSQVSYSNDDRDDCQCQAWALSSTVPSQTWYKYLQLVGKKKDSVRNPETFQKPSRRLRHKTKMNLNFPALSVAVILAFFAQTTLAEPLPQTLSPIPNLRCRFFIYQFRVNYSLIFEGGGSNVSWLVLNQVQRPAEYWFRPLPILAMWVFVFMF